MRLALALVGVVACWTPPPERWGGTPAPLQLINGHVLVRAEANGHPVNFVLDTGASITAITRETAARLGIVGTSSTPVNGRVVPTGIVRRLSLADAHHADVRVALVDVLEVEHRRAYLDGVLGLDVLARHDVVIDFREPALVFHPRHTLVARTMGSELARIPFVRGKHGLPILQVTLERGVVVPAILDLGSPATYFNREAAARSGHAPDTLDRHRIGVGDLELVVPSVLVEDLAAFARLDLAGPAMLLGRDAFGRRTLAIAYADDVILVSR